MSKQSIVRLAIGLTTLISALVSWYCLADILNNSVRDAWIARVLEISLGFIVLETLIGLFFLLEERWSVLLGGQLLALAPFFIFFPIVSWTGLIILLFSFLFLSKGAWQARAEKEARVKLVTARILLRGLAPVTTGLVLLAAAAFGSSAMAQSLSNAPIEMPRALFDKIIDPILRAPGIMTGLVPELNNKTTAPVQPATSENTVLVKDVVYREVNFWISDFSAPNRQYLPLGLAISFFLAARFFWGAVLMRLAAMMGWAIFGLLQIFKVAEIKTEPVDKETIKIKDAV